MTMVLGSAARRFRDIADAVSSAHVRRLPDASGLPFIPAGAEHLP